ncbi:MAG: hypothetical protein CFE30_17560 [Bradyrhizobium sp. PARBB1]|nr:MAG: hypothetical protein CFE30_17560 [Bradyrhizobium sp. PARBB1]PSO26576.1 hypothetical protein C7G43_10835 [Bradyrhizobium sp. MOS004]HAQ82338.1 hypothetical protein [Bradyrhizobium sp.]HAR13391.1 hypothetical protein [Bradyrhizobium sp.]HAR26991.1 hypothetical protein [Bradyrhizobium sp.]
MPRLERGIQYAAAYQLNSNASGILGRPGEPGDDRRVCGECDRLTSPSGSRRPRAARTRRHRPCSDRGSRRTAGCCRCRR